MFDKRKVDVMDYTLHLTDSCNLNCTYCYENKRIKHLSFENIKKLIDYELVRNDKHCVITFYGGEPLLKKDVIYDTIKYIKSQKTKTKFYYNMTTNGTLIDDEFIEFAKKNNFVNVAYSIDGKKETHNLNRKTVDGKDTFNIVSENAKKVLKNFKSVVAMVAVTKNNIKNLCSNVEYLVEFGFKDINLLFNYLDKWTDNDLKVIKEQYKKLSDFYYKKIMVEEDITISLFDAKIKSSIDMNYNCNVECKFGQGSFNIGTDGNMYPCVQFVYNEDFIIGNCENGLDVQKQMNVIKNVHKELDICKTCKINRRCKHTCCCVNYLSSGNENEVSPLVCELERIIVELADELAEKLYKNKSKLFMQKFYNQKYELMKGVLENGIKKY